MRTIATHQPIPKGFVRFQVNGKIYDLSVENLKKYETTLSNMIAVNGSDNTQPIIIDENSVIFEAVLDFHRTGMIVRPPAIASQLWDNRVKYWNLELSSDDIKDKPKYYMIDYLLYFGQKFIRSYNPHEQTLIMKGDKYDNFMNVCLMKYDKSVPFVFIDVDDEVNLVIGMGACHTDLLPANDDVYFYNIETHFIPEQNVKKMIDRQTSKKGKQRLVDKLKEGIEYLLKGCDKRNKNIENVFWEQIFDE